MLHADFHLEGRRDGLDDAALEIAQYQEASLVKRKDLATRTKAFRANASAEVTKGVASLLKQYQEELDRLTKR